MKLEINEFYLVSKKYHFKNRVVMLKAITNNYALIQFSYKDPITGNHDCYYVFKKDILRRATEEEKLEYIATVL